MQIHKDGIRLGGALPVISRALVIADDLTGAADAAVAMAGDGQDAVVRLANCFTGFSCDGVVAVDLNTRGLSSELARTTVEEFVRRVSGHGVVLFKKVDSTLRGHIGPELSAFEVALRSSGYASDQPLVFIVAPAHPLLGRTVADGSLLWRDGAVSVKSLLQKCDLACAEINRNLFERIEPSTIGALIDQAADQGTPWIICDSESTSHLDLLVHGASLSKATCIWVGSGGLAQALSPYMQGSFSQRIKEDEGFRSSRKDGKSALFVVGSFSAVARKQVDCLLQAGDIEQLVLSADGLSAAGARKLQFQMDEALSDGKDIILYIDPMQEVRGELAANYAQCMAELVEPRVISLGALICCGGDTSRHLFERAEVREFHARRSHEVGVTEIACTQWPSLPIYLKAGAFGDDRTLVRIRDGLQPKGLPLPNSKNLYNPGTKEGCSNESNT